MELLLTKAQKNDLWRAIKAGGLDPRTCALLLGLGAVRIASGSHHFDIYPTGSLYGFTRKISGLAPVRYNSKNWAGVLTEVFQALGRVKRLEEARLAWRMALSGWLARWRLQ